MHLDTGRLLIAGVAILALTNSAVRDALGGLFRSLGQDVTHAPVGTPGASTAGGGGGSLAAMEAANPNFVQQVHTWRSLRQSRGENPNDWAAFRSFENGIKAPDPGAAPPSEWPGGI